MLAEMNYIERALRDPNTRWQLETYEMVFKPMLYSRFDCRLSKVAGCFGSDCIAKRIVTYHVCRTEFRGDTLYFAVKFYIKDDMPVVGLSHHIMLASKGHLFYPAIDWDRNEEPPKELFDRAVFVWKYFSGSKKIKAYHIVLTPPRRRWWYAIYDMRPYTDPMHWAVTVRRMVKQSIYEDFAILRVWRLDDQLLWFRYDENDPMAWLNYELRKMFWL